ncbi:MAG: hypothetical protein QOI54_968 [Actinomycetota bacterium]|jgi:hypothetical protein|nr:hypothetical protein [Actinomycetota bacterium]
MTIAHSSVDGPDLEGPARLRPQTMNDILNRGKAMLLIHEDLARAHASARREELLRQERSRRVVRALRAQRRAEEATVRARRLLTLAAVR